MMALLKSASEHPLKWHAIGKIEATQREAEQLQKRGVIKIRQPSGYF